MNGSGFPFDGSNYLKYFGFMDSFGNRISLPRQPQALRKRRKPGVAWFGAGGGWLAARAPRSGARSYPPSVRRGPRIRMSPAMLSATLDADAFTASRARWA